MDFSEEINGNGKWERLLIVVAKALVLEEYEPVCFYPQVTFIHK